MPPSLHLPAWCKAPLPSGQTIRTIPLGAARGLSFTIDFDRHLRFYLGLYERELGPWLTRFATPGTVAYDIGADIGYQAVVVARMTRAAVIGFEPRDEAASQIERHYSMNAARVGRVEVVRAMVGASSGPNQISIDAFVAASERDAPGFLLIDVDGGEADVLRGAERLLVDRAPHLVIETHSASLEQECAALLAGVGYKPVIVKQRRLFGDYRPIAHNRWIAAEGR